MRNEKQTQITMRTKDRFEVFNGEFKNEAEFEEELEEEDLDIDEVEKRHYHEEEPDMFY